MNSIHVRSTSDLDSSAECRRGRRDRFETDRHPAPQLNVGQGQDRPLSDTDDQLRCAFLAHRFTGDRWKDRCGAADSAVDDRFRSCRYSEAAIARSGVFDPERKLCLCATPGCGWPCIQHAVNYSGCALTQYKCPLSGHTTRASFFSRHEPRHVRTNQQSGLN